MGNKCDNFPIGLMDFAKGMGNLFIVSILMHYKKMNL